MAVYYKNIRKYSLRPASVSNWYIQDDDQSFTNPWEQHPTCRHVWWIYNQPDALPDGAALYNHTYLNEPSMHVWKNCTVQAGISESGTGLEYMSDMVTPLYR